MVTMALSRAVSEIFNVEKYRDLEIGVRGLKVIEGCTIRCIVYYFLLVLFSNFVPKMHRFEIFDFKNAVTLKTGLGVRQGHWKCHRSIERI